MSRTAERKSSGNPPAPQAAKAGKKSELKKPGKKSASAKAETRSLPPAETRAETKAGTKAEPKAQPKAATKSTTKSEPKVETKSTTKSEPKVETEAATKTKTKHKAKDKAKAKAKDKTKAKAKDKAKAETKPGSKASGGGKGDKLKAKVYDKELERLQIELVKLQEWVKHAGLKVCVVFEGRDGAGKGGTIKALTERVSPRVFRVVALPAPTDREKSQMYLQRYVQHFPAAGEIVIFDRSWYNRAGVERVMGFCKPEHTERFLQTVPAFEKAMVDAGIILLKFWLEVSEEEQTRRLQSRVEDGRKLWKLSPMDMKSYSRWYEYSRARDAMFAATDSESAPWVVVPSDDKRRAQLNLISHVLDSIPYQELPRKKITFPKRQPRGNYKESDHPFKYVKDRY